MRKWNADLSAVARRAKAERGMSLVEATIILMVLSVLTAVVAPSVSDYVNDSRQVKVKEDVEAIGIGIVRTLRDTGIPCLISATPATLCAKGTRAELIFGEGNDPSSAASNAYTAPVDSIANTAAYNWKGSTAGNTFITSFAANTDTISDQLISNGPDYNTIQDLGFAATMNSTAGVGWRGPYVSAIGADPWGYRYQANTLFLSVANDAVLLTSAEGGRLGGWHRDVFVISSGADGVMQTPFAVSTQSGTKAGGDDVIYTIQGTTK